MFVSDSPVLTASFPGSFLTSNLHSYSMMKWEWIEAHIVHFGSHTTQTDILVVGSVPTCRALTSSIDHSVKVSIFTFDLSDAKIISFQGLGPLFPHSPYDIPISKTISCIAWTWRNEYSLPPLRIQSSIHQANLFRRRADTRLRGNRGYWWCWCRNIIRVETMIQGSQEKTNYCRYVHVDCLNSYNTSLRADPDNRNNALYFPHNVPPVGSTSTGIHSVYDIPRTSCLRTISFIKDKV